MEPEQDTRSLSGAGRPESLDRARSHEPGRDRDREEAERIARSPRCTPLGAAPPVALCAGSAPSGHGSQWSIPLNASRDQGGSGPFRPSLLPHGRMRVASGSHAGNRGDCALATTVRRALGEKCLASQIRTWQRLALPSARIHNKAFLVRWHQAGHPARRSSNRRRPEGLGRGLLVAVSSVAERDRAAHGDESRLSSEIVAPRSTGPSPLPLVTARSGFSRVRTRPSEPPPMWRGPSCLPRSHSL